MLLVLFFSGEKVFLIHTSYIYTPESILDIWFSAGEPDRVAGAHRVLFLEGVS